MSARFALPYAQPVNAAGAPYPGALLYFYVAGSTTPQTTYADTGLTTPNANPVVADSTGTFSAIWLGSNSYRAVLTDTNGVQIWTADNVGPSVVASF